MFDVDALVTQLQKYLGWRYAYADEHVHYPEPIHGVKLPQVEVPADRETNCCTFAEGLIVPVAQRAGSNGTWSWNRHKQMMILGKDMFSPATALVEAGLADYWHPEYDSHPPPPWTLIQGWQPSMTRGHTFFVRAHAPGGKVLTVEANHAWGVNGVGARGLGSTLETGVQIPTGWDCETRWTWERLRRTYPYMRGATLHLGGSE